MIKAGSIITHSMGSGGQNLEVTFVAGGTADEASRPGGSTSCGPGVTYTVNLSGKVLNTVFLR
jgi:hypothetical protein